ncbi:MAG: trigger factor [Synergistetes bacterium]|nr:MAG: Cell division trigger factor [bacterium 42_11]MBC7331437.1 trigger factor [Synergistota bacterium]MDK2871429.1 trigger factor [bacterium]
MKAEILQREGHHAKVKIEIPAEEFSQAVNRAFKKLVKDANIPGFRKGMIPRKVFEAVYGKKIIYDEAIQDIAPPAYDKAIKDLNLDPITRPRISFAEIEEGRPLVFTVDLVLKPEVKLGNYDDIDVTEDKIEVTDEMVNEVLKDYQERLATFEEVKDRPAKLGDFLIVEVKDEKSGEWRKAQLFLSEEVKEKLEGLNVGDERELEIKGERFTIKVLEIREKRLPEINEDFAVSLGFESLEECKKSIREALEAELKRRVEIAFRERVIEKLVELSEVELPEEAVAEEIEYLKESDKRKAEEYGMSLEEFLRRIGIEEGKVSEYYKTRAEKRLKREFVLDALAEKENVSVSDEEVEAELRSIAQENNVPYERVKAFWESEERIKVLKSDIIRRKAIEKVIEYIKGRGEDRKNVDSSSDRADT